MLSLDEMLPMPMLPVLQDQGGRSREVCRDIASCLLSFPSFHPTLVGKYQFHTLVFPEFLFRVVLTGAWRWAAAWLPW